MAFPIRAAAPAFAALALAVLAHPARAESTAYPLAIENCGRTLTFAEAPRSVVSVGQSTTEILYLLGLADRVAGTALWMAPVMKGFEAVNAGVKRLADNDPSFESVVAERPALVATQYEWQIGPKGSVGTPEQFADLGIPVYTSPAASVGKDNSSGGDGVRSVPFSMALVHREIEELARIFGVPDRGRQVVADLRAREAAARRRIAGVSGDVSAVFWFSTADAGADPFVAGTSGAPAVIMETLGIRNVVESREEWPTVGWETIARANPTVIVAAALARRKYPADDVAAKEAFLRADPVTSLMSAVEGDRIIAIDGEAMNPTIRTVEGIEALAEGLVGVGLAR